VKLVEGINRYKVHVLLYAPPGSSVTPVGVFVYDTASGSLYWQLPHDWSFVVDEFDQEYLSLISEDISRNLETCTGEELLTFLENTLSNVLRLSTGEWVTGVDANSVLTQLYQRYVIAAQPSP
jgi:hypothetical protein